MSRLIRNLALLLPMIAGFLLCASLAAQQNSKRLILKDGSYQPATEWKVTGDRVRFHSAERDDWEEIPASLIDWPATEKYNTEREEERRSGLSQMAQQAKQEDAAEQAERPTVAPGLRLPDSGGVYLLDIYRDNPQLVEVVQNGSELNKQMKKNILRAAINPLALSSKQTIELKGAKARVQAHVPQPAIYVNINSADTSGDANAQAKDTDQQPDRYRLVRVDVAKKKDVRVVGNLSIAVYGKVSQKENWIKTNVTPVGNWVKVTPAEPLTPGEYAMVEMLGKNEINLYVWDFGINPTAPQNPNAWTPTQPDKSNTGTNETPVLGKRPPK
jgi:hypothetical protein